jgi:hypothetical protein
MSRQNSGAPIKATATHATSAVATVTGVAGSIYYITDVAGSSDKAGSLLLVKDGSTVIWQVQLATTAAGNNSFQESFQTALPITKGNDVSVTVDGTSACYSNLSGYVL